MSKVFEELLIYSGPQEDPTCTLRSLRLDVNQGHGKSKNNSNMQDSMLDTNLEQHPITNAS